MCSLCPAGTFGDHAGLASAACSGVCSNCTAGSTVALAPVCAAGTVPGAGGGCAPCGPGTYALAGSSVCSLCPAGTFGSRAGLATAACSGSCASCPPGSASPSALSCSAADSRAVPASLGLQVWPAAHPANTQRVNLIVAPLGQCQQLTSVAACAAAANITGADGVARYVIGTAASFNVEPAEALACSS